MKKIFTLSFFALLATGCDNPARQVQQTNATGNANVAAQKQNDSETVSSHSLNPAKTESAEPKNTKPAPGVDSSAENSSPMQRPIDVAEMTAAIEKGEKSFKQNPKDEKTKENLAQSYFARAFALTEAAQYRAALGDFRKGLKLNPNDAEAKKMHDEILRIFASIKREPPKEGEEPQPLRFEKSKA